jgi:capsular polysaccharide biosynthesis protein
VEAGEFLRLLRRRLWFIASLVVLCGVAAGVAMIISSPTYERTLHLVLHPDSGFERTDVPGAIDVLGEDSPLTQTVLGVLQSDRVLGRAFETAGVDTATPEYTMEASLRPGSTLIDATVRGPDRDVVDAIADGVTDEASRYVATTYEGYVLELLGNEAPPDPVGPSVLQVVGLALTCGILLGSVAVFVEGALVPRVRSMLRPGREPTSRRRGRSGSRGRVASRQPPKAQVSASDAQDAGDVKKTRVSASDAQDAGDVKKAQGPTTHRPPPKTLLLAGGAFVLVSAALAFLRTDSPDRARPRPTASAKLERAITTEEIVPNVTGLPAAEARERLMDANLVLQTTVPAVGKAGAVVATQPTLGHAVSPGTPVKLFVGVSRDRLLEELTTKPSDSAAISCISARRDSRGRTPPHDGTVRCTGLSVRASKAPPPGKRA